MLSRIVLAVVVGVVTGLVCLLLGAVLGSMDIPPVSAIAGFLTRWAWVIGILAGLWYFFAGGSWPTFRSKQP